MEEEQKDKDRVNEPAVPYSGQINKRITFFSSFEELNEHQYQLMAAMTVEERMTQLEKLRRRFMSKCLLPDGTWRPLKRTLTIEKTNFK